MKVKIFVKKRLALNSILIDQTAALDGVRLWDLRKLRNFRSFAPYDPETPTNSGTVISDLILTTWLRILANKFTPFLCFAN